MKIFQPPRNYYIKCPACHEQLEWEDSDLSIDPEFPNYYYTGGMMLS